MRKLPCFAWQNLHGRTHMDDMSYINNLGTATAADGRSGDVTMFR